MVGQTPSTDREQGVKNAIGQYLKPDFRWAAFEQSLVHINTVWISGAIFLLESAKVFSHFHEHRSHDCAWYFVPFTLLHSKQDPIKQ